MSNYLPNFSHIYIEEKAKKYPLTSKILNRLSNAKVIEINHYKDIFNRYNQNYREQKNSMKLILAIKEDNFLYEGSSLIQNQGYKNFFYTPIMLNCLYDCHYCFLQGMYTSANIVLFVNIDDFFESVENKLNELNEEMFLSISYDTDLLATEKLFSITTEWINFSQKFDNLKLEIRTKSANYSSISKLSTSKNIFLNWTLSPEIIVDKYEVKTPSLQKRVENLKEAIKGGWRVGIVIDPIVAIDNFEEIYREFVNYIFSEIEPFKIESIIIGTFRMSNSYLKKIKRSGLASDIIYYPYTLKDNIAIYENEKELTDFVKDELKKFVKEDKILTL